MSKRIRILQLLTEHDKLTGGDILDLDETLPKGTIYTTLQRLEDDGLVTSHQEKEPRRPGWPRKFYRTTALGKRTALAAEYAQAAMAGRRLIPVR